MNYIHSWGSFKFPKHKNIGVLDTTLRDGLQSIFIRHPKKEEKIQLLQKMVDIGIDSAEIGFPISSVDHKNDVIALATYAHDHKLPIEIGCMGRTVLKDIEAIYEVSQQSSQPIEAILIAGSSKIRHIVEKWTLHELGNWLHKSIQFAVQHNLTVNFIAEDATRATPHVVEYLYKTAIDAGATTVTIADTVGVVTPDGARKIMSFMKKNVIGKQKVRLDWHGHDDRGLGVMNSLAAIEAGADRVHATGLGIGERAGNTPMEPLLFNLQMEGMMQKNLKLLHDYSSYTSKIFEVPIRENYPGIGKAVHATSVGVHAAATMKAKRMGDDELLHHVYTGVDPRIFGKTIEVLVGPLSGAANVEWRFEMLGLTVSDEKIKAILAMAYTTQRVLSDEEILHISKQIDTSRILQKQKHPKSAHI